MKSDDFLGPLMDDFFAESEEHIVLLRRGLLYLEEEDRASPPAEESLRTILRSLHTVKGLAGMVGFPEAERLAHLLEDWIRDASRGGILPADLSLDPLFEGVALLERALTARRSGSAPLDVDAFVERAQPRPRGEGAATPAAAAAPEDNIADGELRLSAVERYRLDAALSEGHLLLDVAFTPSAALLERGIGVEAIRGRLGEVGEILHASPRVLPGRGVSFRFLLAAPADSADLPDEWRGDGMEWKVVDPATLLPAGALTEAAQPDRPARDATSARAPRHDQIGQQGEAHEAANAIVRVEMSRLEELMRLIGEMVLTRGRLRELISGAAPSGPGGGAPGIDIDTLSRLDERLARQLRDLRGAVMRVRMVPVGELFERMRFVVRDLVADSGRQIRIEMAGQDTEIDKMVVERMMDPLLHLVRNAVSHGIEPPAERREQGKPEQGVIHLGAEASGDRIIIRIDDDGRGIDRVRVEEKARREGIDVPPDLDDFSLLDIICTPGFSTSAGADRASGRGIGMDIVRSTTRALGGELILTTEEGRGAHFAIELPLTLMILNALLVRLGDQVMAVPQPALLEVLQIAAGEIVTFENNEVIRYRGNVLPVMRLAEIFGTPSADGAYLTVLVVGSSHQPLGIAVDAAVGIREIVVRPLTDPLVAVRGVQGATELPDGRVSLIIDVADLIAVAQERRMKATPRTNRYNHV